MSDSDKSYLIYMAVRLLEMHRILKNTGSIYLHCDTTMSYYLKLVMDSVFGKESFLADITWKRYAAHSLSKSAVDTISDHLLYYAKDNMHVMANRVTSPLDTEALNKKFPHVETETGRRFQHVALEQNSNRSSAGETRKIGDKTVTSDIGWRWNQSTFDERSPKIHTSSIGRGLESPDTRFTRTNTQVNLSETFGQIYRILLLEIENVQVIRRKSPLRC